MPRVAIRIHPGRPWWQDLRWITAGIMAVLLALLVWGLFGPEPPITVSRRTTYLTEPLAADGLPDYGAAVLASLGPAPAPEDNAAVELLEVMWPLDINAADLPAVCTALGIPHVPPADPLREPMRDAAAKVTEAMYDVARERPWTAAEFPELEAWLVAHEAPLDRLVAAADRPRYRLPSPEFLRPGPQMLMTATMPDVQSFRAAARLIGCRAMWHAAAGRHADAWHDIRAIYRLGRLLGMPENSSQFAVTQLVGIAIRSVADDALARGLLGSPGLPVDLLAEIRRDLDALGPLPDPTDALACERLMGVDALVWIARRSPGGRAGRARWVDGFSASYLEAAAFTSLDWDVALEWMNNCFDDLDAAVRLPTHAARKAEIDRRQRELTGRLAGRSGWSIAGHILGGLLNRGQRSAAVGDELAAMLVPALGSFLQASTRAHASFDLTRTAAALAAWKADRAVGEDPYPETLDALVPKYLPAVPLDPFTDRPFIYERRGDGYLLASEG